MRLLSGWAPPPHSPLKPAQHDAAEQLAQWLSVADSITLRSAQSQLNKATWVATALNMPAPAQAPGHTVSSQSLKAELHIPLLQQLRDLRATLAATFIQAPSHRGRLTMDATDFATHHQRYMEHQRRMEMGVDAFRAHVQHVLASTPAGTTQLSPSVQDAHHASPMAQLAALDALLNHMLGARIKSLLSRIPAFLKTHFLALRAESQAQDIYEESTPSTLLAAHQTTRDIHPPAWLATFEQSFQAVLQAELDLRLQPIHGMVQAVSVSQDAVGTL